MSSNSEGGRLSAVLDSVSETIGVVKGSKPRVVMFASGFTLLVMAVVLRAHSQLLVLSGIALLALLVFDLARGGTVTD